MKEKSFKRNVWGFFCAKRRSFNST
jgi:hypothetical protein